MSTGGLDAATVGRGAAITLALLVPPVLVVRAFVGSGDPDDDSSPLYALIGVAFLLSFVIGGRIAASRAPSAPYKHAAAVGAVAFGVALLAGVVRNVVTGRSMGMAALVTAVLLLQIATSLAMLGALLGSRARTREGTAS